MRVRRQEAVFMLGSLTMVAVLVSLTVAIGMQADLFSLPSGPYAGVLGGLGGGLLFLWGCWQIRRMHLNYRHLGQEYAELRLDLETAREEMERLYSKAVKSLTATLEARDGEMLGRHVRRVAGYSLLLAQELQLPPEAVIDIYYASVLHDIGKIGIPEAILNKPARLNQHEMEEIRRHPAIGREIVKNLLNREEVLSPILHHHEFYDGTGYPAGLARQAIPLGARIISIADAYDAMTSNRPYRHAFTHEQAMVELIKNAGTQFDPSLISHFLKIVERGELKARPGGLPSFACLHHPISCKVPVN